MCIGTYTIFVCISPTVAVFIASEHKSCSMSAIHRYPLLTLLPAYAPRCTGLITPTLLISNLAFGKRPDGKTPWAEGNPAQYGTSKRVVVNLAPARRIHDDCRTCPLRPLSNTVPSTGCGDGCNRPVRTVEMLQAEGGGSHAAELPGRV